MIPPGAPIMGTRKIRLITAASKTRAVSTVVMMSHCKVICGEDGTVLMDDRRHSVGCLRLIDARDKLEVLLKNHSSGARLTKIQEVCRTLIKVVKGTHTAYCKESCGRGGTLVLKDREHTSRCQVLSGRIDGLGILFRRI